MKSPERRQIFKVILTGLSGAGKTVALNAFEDSNYFCVDNLPVSLIKTFIHLCYMTPDISKIAVGIDIREMKFFNNLSDAIHSLKKTEKAEIIFLEAKEGVIIRRFKETRRPHPLGYKDLKRAIRKEMEILSPIRSLADKVIDTSSLTPHELRKIIIQRYSGKKESSISVSLISFGYKYGTPPEADLLFDARFLPNPNFIKELKRFPGTSPKVKNFLLEKQATKDFLDRLVPFLEFLIPKYKDEGRNYLTIGIGCTGGRHRSPVIVEEIKKYLEKHRLTVSVLHRDIHELAS